MDMCSVSHELYCSVADLAVNRYRERALLAVLDALSLFHLSVPDDGSRRHGRLILISFGLGGYV